MPIHHSLSLRGVAWGFMRFYSSIDTIVVDKYRECQGKHFHVDLKAFLKSSVQNRDNLTEKVASARLRGRQKLEILSPVSVIWKWIKDLNLASFFRTQIVNHNSASRVFFYNDDPRCTIISVEGVAASERRNDWVNLTNLDLRSNELENELISKPTFAWNSH